MRQKTRTESTYTMLNIVYNVYGVSFKKQNTRKKKNAERKKENERLLRKLNCPETSMSENELGANEILL